MNTNRVLLMQLSERTSAKGNVYLAGWLGRASVVAFPAEETDKYGNPVLDVYVSTPDPEPEPRQRSAALDDAAGEVRPEAAEPSSASTGAARMSTKSSARPEKRDPGWRGPSAYRRPSAPRQVPGADDGDLVEDGLADLYQ